MSATDWTFSGIVERREDKTSKNGKAFSELVIVKPDAKYSSICVCTFWGALPDSVRVGAGVDAAGYMAGREYNQKHYAGLRATVVTAQQAQRSQPPQDDRA